MAKSLLWLKKTSAILTLLLLIAGVGIQASFAQNAPYVVSTWVTPASFNPSNNEQTTISYQLSAAGASVTVEVIDPTNMSVKKTFNNAPNSYLSNNSVVWNGKDVQTGQPLPNGTYYYFIRPNTQGTNIVSGTVVITGTTSGSSSTTTPVVTALNAPDSFNALNGGQATITYMIDRYAYSVEMLIQDASGQTRRTFSGLNVIPDALHSVTWNGRDQNDNLLPTGTYTIVLRAKDVHGGVGARTRTINLTGSTYNPGTVVITSVTAYPSTINQTNDSTTISYYLDRAATSAFVEIFDQNNVRRRYIQNTTTNVSQQNTVVWNGRDDSGNTLPPGIYTVVVSAVNAYGTATNNSARVTLTSGSGSGYCGNLGTSLPVLTSVYAQPNSINASNNESATIYYTVDRAANVTIEVMDANGGVLRTLVNDMCVTANTTNSTSWNGRDNNGSMVINSNYTVRVRARTAPSYEAVKYVYIQVTGYTGGGTSTGTVIRDFMVSPEVFNPRLGQTSTVYYNLAQNASVTVDILDRNGNFVRTIVNNVSRYTSNYNYTNTFGRFNYADVWNGTDSNGYVSDNLYQFRVRAVGSNGVTDTRTGWVEVDTNNSVIGFPSGSNCAGYRDVSANSPYCKALQAMSDVFQGYGDNTARLYQLINRAETAAVVARAFDIQENVGYGSLGFYDTNDGAWYAPFVRALRSLGVIHGYPDRSFRPEQTVKRVELAKIFAETARSRGVQLMVRCSNAPFSDTQLNVWYSDYVCTMKRWNLMSDDGVGRFNGTAAMTRADVLDLFYRYEVSGLSQGVNYFNSSYNYYNFSSYRPYTYTPSMYSPLYFDYVPANTNYSNYNTPYYQDYIQY